MSMCSSPALVVSIISREIMRLQRHTHTHIHTCTYIIHTHVCTTDNSKKVQLAFSPSTQEDLAQRYAGTRIQSMGSFALLAGLLIRSESIVAVARGGAEFGPRALGHRSFLAAAHRGELKERLKLGYSRGINLCDLVSPHTLQSGAMILTNRKGPSSESLSIQSLT